MTAQENKSRRKVKKGIVLSNKMNKTVVVGVTKTIRHPVYGKVVKKTKKYYVHNENEKLEIGAEVTIVETRPLSKTKCWRVVNSK